MDGTIIQQGSFTADGAARRLVIRSDVDWMNVYNYTVINAHTATYGANFYWQRGMAAANAIINNFDGAGTAMVMTTAAAAGVGGFTLVDSSSITAVRAPNLITDITAAAPAVISSVAHGLVTGSIFRLVNCVGAQQITGIDFSCTRVGANTFSPTWMPAIVAAAAPGASAFVYRINYDSLYYPRNRVISAITQAAQAVVTMTVTHSLTIGQIVRFSIPRVTNLAFGMTELDGQTATITAINVGNNTITVDIDTLAYTAFAFPLTADIAFTPAQVIPIGEAAEAVAGKITLDDATLNTGYIGIFLAAGNNSPAGNNNDVIYWTAGKSFNL